MLKSNRSDLDLSTLLSIITAERSEQAHRGLRSRRLEALKAWKNALLDREDATRSLELALADPPMAPEACELYPDPVPAALVAPVEVRCQRMDPEELAPARGVSAIGATVPDFPYYGPLRRFFARITAKLVLFLAGIVTSHQRIVNSSLLDFAAESISRINHLLENVEASLERDTGLSQAIAQLRSEFRERLHDHAIRILEQQKELAVAHCEQVWLRLAEAEQREKLGELQEHLKRAEAPSLRSDLIEHALQSLPDEVQSEPKQSRDLDQLYVSLEEQFRGPRDLIKRRFETYLPMLHDSRFDSSKARILDLGCGRGEWLELLSDHSYNARGVDVNQIMVSHCRALGLDVVAEDALSFLRKQPEASLDIVTGFHLLEHLPFNYLIALLDETLRSLRPGGFTIFETPNPENLTVSSSLFHCDPTHHHPIHPQLLSFLLRRRGFVQLEIRRLHDLRLNERFKELEDCHPEAEIINPIVDFLNTQFAAATDFAAIGYKPETSGLTPDA
jgi:SAM-dependent methyltransferase